MANVFTTTIETNLPEQLDSDRTALLFAARKVVGGRVKYLKNWLRRLITRAGLGQRLANTIRAESHDTQAGVTGTVWSKAKVRRATGTWDLITVFAAATDIHVAGKHFLAIPLPAAGRGSRGRPPTPQEIGTELLVPRIRGDKGVLVLKSDPEGEPLFVLTHEVHLRQRLDLSGIERLAKADLSGRIIREWERRRARVALRRVA